MIGEEEQSKGSKVEKKNKKTKDILKLEQPSYCKASCSVNYQRGMQRTRRSMQDANTDISVVGLLPL